MYIPNYLPIYITIFNILPYVSQFGSDKSQRHALLILILLRMGAE